MIASHPVRVEQVCPGGALCQELWVAQDHKLNIAVGAVVAQDLQHVKRKGVSAKV